MTYSQIRTSVRNFAGCPLLPLPRPPLVHPLPFPVALSPLLNGHIFLCPAIIRLKLPGCTAENL